MPKDQDKEDSTTKKIKSSLMLGAGVTLVQSPVLTALSNMSVVAWRNKLSTTEALSFIYAGKVSGKGASAKNFCVGIGAHLGREAPRLLLKSTGLYMYKPWLDNQFPPFLANILFAGTLTAADTLVNPFDTWRVNIQAGIPLEKSLSRLYAGSLGNGLIKFGIWWGYSFSGRHLDDGCRTYTFIDPHSHIGITIKSIPQGFFLTSFLNPVECIKNELQCSAEKTPSFGSKYTQAISKVYKTEGFRGFFRGFIPNMGRCTVLSLGMNMLERSGRRHGKN
jgi:hypothetical protein